MNKKSMYIISSICISLVLLLFAICSTHTYSANTDKSRVMDNDSGKVTNDGHNDSSTLKETTFSGLIEYVSKKEQVKKYNTIVTGYKEIPIEYIIPNVPVNRVQVGPTCWAVSAINAIESTIANTGIDSSYGKTKRINPYHMIHALNQKIGTNKNSYGFRDEKNHAGGTPLNTLIYLTNGMGFTTNNSYFYNQSNSNSSSYSQGSLTLNTMINSPKENYQVKSIQIIPGIDIVTLDAIGEQKFSANIYVNNKINDIKKMIMSGKGVTITSRSTQKSENPCYREDLHSAYCPSKFIDSLGAHMTLIVGWDDNYSKDNFKKTVGNKVNPGPPADGAWKIRNSYSYDGYYYISYYDYTTLYNSNIVITSVDLKDYDNIYQYNPSGCDSDYNCLELDSIEGDVVNVYTKNTSTIEQLKSISFYADKVSDNNKVRIYFKEGEISISSLSSLFSQENYLGEVEIPTNGFYTFDLNQSIKLTSNKFYVGLRPTNNYTLKIQGRSNSLMTNSDVGIKEGNSYYYNGNTYSDLASYETPSSAFIKVYTKNTNELPATNHVQYTVKYYLEKLDGEYELKDTKNLTGIIGEEAKLENYDGFINPKGIKLTEDTKLVEYKYERKTYTVTLNKIKGIKSVTGMGTYKHGESVTIDATLTKGYTWSRWIGENTINTQKYTFTMPNKNIIYTAIAEKENSSSIKVKEVSIKNCPTSPIKIDESLQLTTIIKPDDATNKDVVWKIPTYDIITINSNGKIKAIRSGTVTVTAVTVEGGFESLCKITVIDNIKEDNISNSTNEKLINQQEQISNKNNYKYIFIIVIAILLLINTIRILIKYKNQKQVPTK